MSNWTEWRKMNPRFIDPEMQALYESYIKDKIHWKRAEKKVLRLCRRKYWEEKIQKRLEKNVTS